MDYKYIEQLLDRYFRAETTLQEEQILKTFFAQGAEDMPQELQQYAPLFAAFDEQPVLGDDFDERVLAQLPADIVPLQPKQVKARTIRLTERLRPLFGAAAAAWVNGKAGELAQSRFGSVSMTAGDTAACLPEIVLSLEEMSLSPSGEA